MENSTVWEWLEKLLRKLVGCFRQKTGSKQTFASMGNWNWTFGLCYIKSITCHFCHFFHSSLPLSRRLCFPCLLLFLSLLFFSSLAVFYSHTYQFRPLLAEEPPTMIEKKQRYEFEKFWILAIDGTVWNITYHEKTVTTDLKTVTSCWWNKWCQKWISQSSSRKTRKKDS